MGHKTGETHRPRRLGASQLFPRITWLAPPCIADTGLHSEAVEGSRCVLRSGLRCKSSECFKNRHQTKFNSWPYSTNGATWQGRVQRLQTLLSPCNVDFSTGELTLQNYDLLCVKHWVTTSQNYEWKQASRLQCDSVIVYHKENTFLSYVRTAFSSLLFQGLLSHKRAIFLATACRKSCLLHSWSSFTRTQMHGDGSVQSLLRFGGSVISVSCKVPPVKHDILNHLLEAKPHNSGIKVGTNKRFPFT